jgi:exo-beta-1,3-glucanase (GH17 family)
MSVADSHARESGMDAMRNTPGYDHHETNVQHYQESPYQQQHPQDPYQQYSHDPAYEQHQEYSHDHAYQQHPLEDPFADPYARRPEVFQSSLAPLGAAAFPPGISTPQSRSIVSRSPPHSFVNDPYSDNPYNDSHRYSRNLDPSLAGDFDPNAIEDDGDDGLEYRREHRSSMLSLGNQSKTGGAAKGAAAGGLLGAFGGIVGRSSGGGQPTQYDAVHNAAPAGAVGPTAYGGAHDYDLGNGQEKSEWLNKQQKGNKKLWWWGSLVLVLIVLGVVGGAVAGTLLHKKSTSSSASNSGTSASSDTATNGDLNKNSAEIKALLNNKNLHKVFPGVDYTPMYTQYPGCLSYPASQNNVTRDLAVLSQLTNIVRLYGTDCNQTELVLHSIDQLGLKGSMKVWMGVWLDSNTTTNNRQIAQMYDIFKKYGADSFEGVIVGNEVLFRKDMTEAQLVEVITGVKTNLTSMNINVPVASSDLGDNWTSSFASKVDYIMSNIHPFFAGVTAEEASSWTYEFWTGHDTILTTPVNMTKNIISETGWPSQGGTDCGGPTNCTTGSVAGISEMNTFMKGWVCDALTNGTNYFWFEAFDEPWKFSFDTPGQEWEDHWGLMDVDRNLKSGVEIPDCGGKTVPNIS